MSGLSWRTSRSRPLPAQSILSKMVGSKPKDFGSVELKYESAREKEMLVSENYCSKFATLRLAVKYWQ